MQEVRYWYNTPARRNAQDARNKMEVARSAAALRTAWDKRRRLPLTVICGDGNIGVKGSGFELLFSIPEQGPVSLRKDGKEWLWRAPTPAFWRASTDNDRGCGFPQHASAWMAADVFLRKEGCTVLEKSEQRVQICYKYSVPLVPGAGVEITYTVEPQAALRVDAVYHGVPGAPELPCFGVKFQTFAPVARAQWTGLSGETYPDRYKGGVFGCHEEVPHIAPALVPQDCGLHMDTQQVVLQLADGSELTLEQTGEPFAFSALPNTAQEIEAAQHISELPNTGRTSITVLGAVRGVGGIDSWGTDVEKPYHIPGDRDHSVSFRIVF